jgi:nitroreductase
METVKKVLRPFYVWIFDFEGTLFYKKLYLILNYIEDWRLFKKYSIVFHKNDFKNKEADLILNYHSLEKGMLFSEMKKSFAPHRVTKLHQILKDKEIVANSNLSQVKVGYQVMCKYYELHKNKGYNISEIFNEEQYQFYKNILSENYSAEFSGILNWSKSKFFENSSKDFKDFANSRKSTREFTGEKIPDDILYNVIKLANTAPSVCNRQASNVYIVEDKRKIDEILKIQSGFAGYTKNVNQLLIVTNDRKYYYTIGERNQFYIDGGIYVMNLLYALHYYKIGNCPANWGKTSKDEKQLAKVITIPESEKIMCLIPIGELNNDFSTTLSKRRDVVENFIKL